MRGVRESVCLLLLLVVGYPAWAEPSVVGDLKIKPNKIGVLKLEGAPAKSAVLWRYDKASIDGRKVGTKSLWYTAAPGTYVVDVFVFYNDKEGTPVIEETSVEVTVEGTPTPPPGPTPGPGPGPNPPTPPTPGPVKGMHVLMVFESGDASTLTPGQQAVLYSKSVRDYLNSKCPTGPDGKTKEWRIYDKDVDLSGETKTWQDVMKRERKQVPWIVISDEAGKVAYEGALPDNPDKALELLKQYGG